MLVLLCGCSVNYQRLHHTELLRVYHNAPHPPHDLNPVWAEQALVRLARELDVDLDRIAPVDVYVDCDEDSEKPSRFNRFTKSIFLRVGQAELPRLFIHELTHRLLDTLDGTPEYWVDQGLAEYMESRCGRSRPDVLLPPSLERSREEMARIGKSDPGDLPRRLGREAIDEGWSWTAPFVHFLLDHWWSDRSPAQKVRLLLDLRMADVEQLAQFFIDYCRTYDPEEEFLRQYRDAPPEVRIGLLGELHWRFHLERDRLLRTLTVAEEEPAIRRLIASSRLIVATPGSVGRVFEEVATVLHPESVPDLGTWSSGALVEHLMRTLRIDPGDWRFPMVAPLLAAADPPIDLDTIAAWFERWPLRMVPFMDQPRVQEHVAARIADLDAEGLRVVLAFLPLVESVDSGVPVTALPDAGTPVTTLATTAASRSRASVTPAAVDPPMREWVARTSLLDTEVKRRLTERLVAVILSDGIVSDGIVSDGGQEWLPRARARAAALLLHLATEIGAGLGVSLPPVIESAASDTEDVRRFARRYLSRHERMLLLGRTPLGKESAR